MSQFNLREILEVCINPIELDENWQYVRNELAREVVLDANPEVVCNERKCCFGNTSYRTAAILDGRHCCSWTGATRGHLCWPVTRLTLWRQWARLSPGNNRWTWSGGFHGRRWSCGHSSSWLTRRLTWDSSSTCQPRGGSRSVETFAELYVN